jgi:hypothetical protein
MRGPDEMRDKLATLIRDAAPPKIALLRPVWDYDRVQLPDIDLVKSGEMTDDLISGDLGTAIVCVTNPRLLNTDQVDIDPYGQAVYNTRYSCQLFVWCQAPDWDVCIAARDHLAAVVRLCLLEWPNLQYNTYGNTDFRLHRDTYTEQFSEPGRLSNRAGGKLWAPARIAIDADREDSIHDGSLRPARGTADTISPAATAVGPGEPLPGAGA